MDLAARRPRGNGCVVDALHLLDRAGTQGTFDDLVSEQGEDPLNTFRDPDQNVYLSMRTERPLGQRYAGTLTRQGAATKYSPILNRRGYAAPLEGGPITGDLGDLIPIDSGVA